MNLYAEAEVRVKPTASVITEMAGKTAPVDQSDCSARLRGVGGGIEKKTR